MATSDIGNWGRSTKRVNTTPQLNFSPPKVQTPNVSAFKPSPDLAGGFGGGRNAPGMNAGDNGLEWGADTFGNPIQGLDADAGFDIAGDWLKPAEFGLGVVGVGLDIYNAFEQSKMNDFMKDYYGNMMDIQRADFSNNAKSANYELEERSRRIASAQGKTTGTAENDAYVKDRMENWGLQETV